MLVLTYDDASFDDGRLRQLGEGENGDDDDGGHGAAQRIHNCGRSSTRVYV